ncbi:uncharacterized protein HD556DRAFT_1232622, partial [Suillus plorans]
MNWTDAQRVQRFGMQLTPGEAAEEWYQSLTSKQLSSFADLKLVFFKCWPHPKCPKLTRAQQKERIMAQVLKEEEVGEWTQVGRTGNYAHVIWAINVSKLALGMGDVNGAMIEYTLEGIPNVLKDHLECAYTTWEEFVEDIQKVPNVKLKRSREDLEKNRARDAEIAKLKAQNSPSPLLLSQQFAQMSIPAQQTVPTSYCSTPRMFNPNMSTSTFPPVTTQPMFNVGPFMTPRNGPPVYNGTRGAFPPRTPLTRAQILERTALVPQRPNTEAGMRQYEGDVDLWHHTYGTDGMTTLDRPYPLRPGTALVGSGECYNCGMVTEPTHLSSQCTTSSPLRPHETKWRQQVAGMLRLTPQVSCPHFDSSHVLHLNSHISPISQAEAQEALSTVHTMDTLAISTDSLSPISKADTQPVSTFSLSDSFFSSNTDAETPADELQSITIPQLHRPQGEKVRILAIVDNGAMINAMDTAAHQRIAQRLTPLSPSSRTLCMADGSLVPSTGIWTGTVSWGPINVHTSFEVFPSGGSWRMLIGKPLLEQVHAIQDYGNDAIML